MIVTATFLLVGVAFGASISRRHTGLDTHLDKRQFGLAQTQRINASRPDFSPVHLDILTKTGGRNDTAPLLYGVIFEDITHSGDGGIYGELIRNRAFQGSEVTTGVRDGFVGLSILDAENPIIPYGPVTNYWRPIGDVRLSLDVLHPLSNALPTVLEVDIPYNATGEVGLLNEGWWGFDVKPQTYNASFYILASGPRFNKILSHIEVSLRSKLTNDVWARSIIPVDGKVSTYHYTRFETQICNTATVPNANSSFAISFNASEVAGTTFYISLFSLFGETFKGRQNGLRKDIADLVYDARPKFLRFPGGNNLEGRSIATHWKWYNTIGPLRDRPGRVGAWNYYNTDGLGLLEYMEWCEDMGMEPILDIYAGASLDQFSLNQTNSVPEDQMQGVLQEALDQLEYLTGNTSTFWGALRARDGHPKPFTIRYLEIGNEDFFSQTYKYRFRILYNGLRKVYPHITYITSYFNENPFKYTPDITAFLPPGSMYDFHHYDEPSYFVENFNQWDNWQQTTNNPNVTVFIGEYQCISIDTPDGQASFSSPADQKLFFPETFSAIAEAVYQLGAERNPNTVKMMALAPILANFNNYASSPNTATYTANDTLASASYWQQWLFARFRGKQTVQVRDTMGQLNPLFWVATIDEGMRIVYLKVVNTGYQAVPLSVNMETPFSCVNGTILTSPNPNDYNFFNNRTAVIPRPADVPRPVNGTLEWNVPPFSSTVLQFDL